MGRFYSVPFSSVAVSTAVDVFEITASSTKSFYLHEIVISQSSDFGDVQAEGLNITFKRGVTITPGSGGTTVVPAKHHNIDSASSTSAKTNNTTQALVGAGTLTVLRSDGFNIQSGYQYLVAPEQRLYFTLNEVLIVSLSLPADGITLSGTLIFEEV